ncbi:3'-5' exonuclease [Candidatus Anaplasma sp. TIGMIC]|uniref:3'-5' exonuclease n=1 Tax=Candidatus Anaplasma sp. TIGMIC TaxID=3020713 RepID=UPI00232F5FD1|nr:3'-5' exonuclease [Candidatus Anaplasma sp. TIGMIC]MDB1135013.1 3'-5' exonuclease [Candidatus Anaplasma sp. TIGMIC]
MLDSLLVFDIETIPDVDSCDNLLGDSFDADADIFAKREAMVNYHLEITNGQNPFLRQPFHKIVAVSFLRANIRREGGHEYFALQEIRSGGTVESSEYDLVKGFFSYLASIRPRIVTFNGRTFDLPVLKYRAMLHGVQVGYLYKSGDKWNNYFQRYSVDWHCDLLDCLSDFGTSARVKMHEVCAVLGFPGKYGASGSDVADMYDRGELSKIRDYCETDVINTYLVYLRLMHHQERITTNCYNECVESMLTYLDNSGLEHMIGFKSEWERVSKGKMFLPAS